MDAASPVTQPPQPAQAPSIAAPRTGAELIKASAPFAEERPLTSWLLLAETLAALATTLALAVLVPRWPVQVLAGILAGLIQVRLFIFYHDALHGAIFRGSLLARPIMSLVGFYTIAVRSVWTESHDFHHQHNSDIGYSSVGSYPLVSVGMLRRLTPSQVRQYRAARHPLTIALGYLTVFLIGMVVGPFKRDPGKHWGAPLAVALHLGLIAAVWLTAGWMVALAAVIIPTAVASAVGSYLFYAQHNFPAMQLKGRRDWNYVYAALNSSSMFEMGPLMEWFTGSIGYHHVHHLNHRIPFYRLREAMRAIPECHHPGTTSWRLRDVRGCLSMFAWDAEQGRMLTRREAMALPAPATAPVGAAATG